MRENYKQVEEFLDPEISKDIRELIDWEEQRQEKKYHPLANIFPMLPEKELKALSVDIKKNGLIENVKLFNDEIIDGRNRYEACKLVDIKPTYTTLTDIDPLQYVISTNLKRRHLTAGQAALTSARLANIKNGGDKKSDHWPNSASDISNEQAAKMFNIGVSIIKDAKWIINKHPECIIEIETGKETIAGVKKRELKKEEVEKRRQEAAILKEKEDKERAEAEQKKKVAEQQVAEAKKEREEIKAKKKVAEQQVAQAKTKVEETKAKEQIQQVEEQIQQVEEQIQVAEQIIETIEAQQSLTDIRLGDFTKVLNDIPDDSLDLILTDPPYPYEFIECWTELGKFAQKKLKDGGFLIAYSGHMYLPEVINKVLESGMKWYWIGSCLHGHYGQDTETLTLVHPVNILAKQKPILFFYKGTKQKQQTRFEDVFLSIKTDKKYHEWGQSINPFDKLIKIFEPTIVCDPFLGGGTTAIACMMNNVKCIGAELNEDTYNICKKRINEYGK